MNKIKVLIINNSYVISSGLQNILNEITEITYSNIEFNEKNLLNDVAKFNPELLIINELVFKFLKLEKQTTTNVLIVIGDENKESHKYFINTLNDNKSTVISLIRKCITENFEKPTKIKNESLSSRENEIIKYVAIGFTNQEIADKLFISKYTVITHRKNITNKLNIKTVSGLTVYAILNNIIDINDVN